MGYNIFVQEKFAERPDGVSAKVRNINNMHSYMCIWVCYACTLLYMCCTCTHRDMNRCTGAFTHPCIHMYMYTHITQTCTQTYTYICTQICTHAHTHVHTHAHTNIYTYMFTNKHTHMHTNMHVF